THANGGVERGARLHLKVDERAVLFSIAQRKCRVADAKTVADVEFHLVDGLAVHKGAVLAGQVHQHHRSVVAFKDAGVSSGDFLLKKLHVSVTTATNHQIAVYYETSAGVTPALRDQDMHGSLSAYQDSRTERLFATGYSICKVASLKRLPATTRA